MKNLKEGIIHIDGYLLHTEHKKIKKHKKT